MEHSAGYPSGDRKAAIETSQHELSNVRLIFYLIGHRSCQVQVTDQNYIFHQFRLLRAEFSYKLHANRSERFYIMVVHNGVPE